PRVGRQKNAGDYDRAQDQLQQESQASDANGDGVAQQPGGTSPHNWRLERIVYPVLASLRQGRRRRGAGFSWRSSDCRGPRQDDGKQRTFPAAFQFVELGARGARGFGFPNHAQTTLEVGVAQIATDLCLFDDAVDVFTNAVEGADIRIGRQAVQCLLQPQAGL